MVMVPTIHLICVSVYRQSFRENYRPGFYRILLIFFFLRDYEYLIQTCRNCLNISSEAHSTIIGHFRD